MGMHLCGLSIDQGLREIGATIACFPAGRDLNAFAFNGLD